MHTYNYYNVNRKKNEEYIYLRDLYDITYVCVFLSRTLEKCY